MAAAAHRPPTTRHALRTWRPGRPVAVHPTLSALRRGPADPAYRVLVARAAPGGPASDGIVWRATRTPDGPVLLRVGARAQAGEVEAEAWGQGAGWALDHVPELLGDSDDPAGFVPRPEHRRLVEAWRRHRSWRVPRSRAVFEALAAAALEQVVTGQESRGAWRVLLRRYGDPAPGGVGSSAPTAPGGPAAGMLVPPSAAGWAQIPSWEWLSAGVELRRRRVVLAAVPSAGRLEATVELGHPQAAAALRSLPGVGVWTAAEVRQRAHGDPDAFSYADYHVARNVSWALTGRVLDDAGCASVIACYAGHRYRVQRLLELDGQLRPRRAPRMTVPSHTPAATRGRS